MAPYLEIYFVFLTELACYASGWWMKSLETCVGENLPFILQPVHAAQSVGLPLPTSASMFCSIADSLVVVLPDRNRTRAPFPLPLPSEGATTLDCFLTHFPLPMIAFFAPLFCRLCALH